MPPINRRKALPLLAAAATTPTIFSSVRAQSTGLPEGTVRMLLGFPAGGGTDVMGRIIGEAIRQRTGRSVVIENKVGASGTIAGEALKNAAPDGLTISYIPSATIVQKFTLATIPFDPQTDFVPLTLAGTVQTAYCVSPTLGVNTLAEYIAWLKKNPTRHSFGTTALGSFTHFFGVMAGEAIGTPLEPIPYRGAAPLVADLQGGHIAAGCGGVTDFLEHQRAGKLKILFTSGLKPAQAAPELPTATSLGYPKLNILGWYVFFAPAKTPAPIVAAWNRELVAVLESAEVKKRLIDLGLDAETSTPEAAAARIDTDLKRWKGIIDGIGYKPRS